MARARKSSGSTASDATVEPLGGAEPNESQPKEPGLVLQPVENVVRKLSETFAEQFGEAD